MIAALRQVILFKHVGVYANAIPTTIESFPSTRLVAFLFRLNWGETSIDAFPSATA